MTDFSDAFAGVTGTQGNNSNTGRKQIDFAAYNKELVDVCGTQNKAKSTAGVISGIVFLGEQPLPDGKAEFVGTEEDERALVAEKPDTYFVTEGGKRYKCWPQKPRPAVAITVDFPRLQFSYNKYFGNGDESIKKPVRMLLNGEFTMKGGHPRDAILGRVYELKVMKDKQDRWSIPDRNILYKMAVATGVINQGDVFLPQDIGKLIGKYAQFEMRMFLNEKGYLQERIKFVGSVPDEIVEMGLPEVPQDILYAVRFDQENNPEDVKMMRRCIRNQIKKAVNYEGSPIQKQIEALEASYNSDNNAGNSEAKKEDKPAPAASEGGVAQGSDEPPADDAFDDDIPF